MLDWYYLHESPLPLDVSEIARLIRMRTHTDCIAVVLQEFFVRTDSGWKSHRADQEIAKAGEKSNKASMSAKARWNKQPDTNAMRTHSESNATQDTIHITQDAVKKKATVVACPPDVGLQVWQDWLALRKAKKAPVTETVLKSARTEAEKAGISLSDFLTIWCARGSQGLEASWLKQSETQALSKTGQVNQRVISGLTRGLIGGGNNVKLLGN